MGTIKKFLSGAWAASGQVPYLRVILLLVLLILSVIAFYKCGSAPSQNEIDLQKNTGEVIETQAETNVAIDNVEKGEAKIKVSGEKVKATREVANKAVKAAEEKRESKPGDVTYAEANKSRCAAYPSDKECQ
jgi:preprotein translocase subunit SecF